MPFINASAGIFQGLRGLLDDQVAAERRPAALIRLRKYAGMEPGYQPFTELLKAREIEQIAKPGVIYPSQSEVRDRARPQLQLCRGHRRAVQEVPT